MSPDPLADPMDSVQVVLARMEVKLDRALEIVADHEQRMRVVEAAKVDPSLDGVTKDHETRIRALERVALRTAGAGGALGFVAGIVGAWVNHK